MVTGIPVLPAPRRVDDGDGAWRQHGRCRDMDPDLFFPEGGAGWTREQYRRLRPVCLGCPVRLECLRAAVVEETGYRHGFRGGLTPQERANPSTVAAAISMLEEARRG